ncbi:MULTISPECIES: P-loop NTPase family protein [unclassified Leptolyngbya]|uniref:P-loop NTPase family protein n=1 Tax=unclassified Leptolyngbya TaxID=2650499 RepID=UPI001688F17B|nr:MULTISPECIES: P-loop NTPase family protein [unclassified Leptolyngbya]MBD1912519.1 P-loop NTPase family protein [Leptolyngbya sp. FACHB-8]MBD2156470.1 P-loop NTPase family protein [Leptolyngbya sp. FACHB-16]
MVFQLETSVVGAERPILPMIEGLVRVFTGPHRSFYTDVIAQALRTAGQGNSVLVVQFLKGGIRQGSDHPVRLGQRLDWFRCDLPRYIDTPELEDTERQALQNLWEHTRRMVREGRYSLVVLDELSLAINFGLIPEAEVLEFLRTRPPEVEVVLTGPNMPESVLSIADQITELKRMYSP